MNRVLTFVFSIMKPRCVPYISVRQATTQSLSRRPTDWMTLTTNSTVYVKQRQVAAPALEQSNPARRANTPQTWLPMQLYRVPPTVENANTAADSTTYSTTVALKAKTTTYTLRTVKKGRDKIKTHVTYDG